MSGDDPFEILAADAGPIEPPAHVRRRIRAQLLDALGLSTDPELRREVELTPRKDADMAPTTPSPVTASRDARTAPGGNRAVPYLAVDDGAAALDWYRRAFGAVETMRVTGDDGRVGHAEIDIGGASFYLSDEYPEYGVVSPRTLGGTSVTLHLTVGDVDAVYGAAAEAGAIADAPPADQSHGTRHGTLRDPFGHRWMLSQQIEDVGIETYRARASADGFRVSAPTPGDGQIWAAIAYRDAAAGITFLTDVLGFSPRIVVPNDADPSVIEHSELVWPDGGTVQAHTADRPGNPYSARPVGSQSLYVVTPDPDRVWERCRAAGVDVIAPPSEPEYAPGTMIFSIRDPEGNIFSFGSYAGDA